MGIQTMGSQGGGGQHSHFQAIAGQGSFYSLTLNEVQSQLREPLHSMNLDELIRNVLPPEGDQTLTIDLGSSNSSLHRQGSVLLTRALSKKTVDEVWRDIQQGTYKSADLVRPSSHGKQQPTLGEMTLEDFLVKAGVVVEGSQRNLNGSTTSTGSPVAPVASTQGFHQTPHWLQQYQQQMPSLLQQQQQQTHHVPARPAALPIVPVNNIMDSSYPDTRISMSLSDTQTPGRKRVAPGEVVEKTVERRQKRMIKNRESAARSRARKQAYTNELENKVSRLEEENEMLRKQKELDKLLYNPPPLEPKYRLRRISSAPF